MATLCRSASNETNWNKTKLSGKEIILSGHFAVSREKPPKAPRSTAYTHELLAMLFVDKTRVFREAHRDLANVERLETILTGSIKWCASPRTRITVCETGEVKARRFIPGTALKEPDCMIHTGFLIPVHQGHNLCVIEVAYQNEDVAGPITEAKLWTQQSTTRNHVAARQALNFIGLHVAKKSKDIQDESQPNAFGLLLCPAHGHATCAKLDIPLQCEQSVQGGVDETSGRNVAPADRATRRRDRSHSLQFSLPAAHTVKRLQ